MRTEELPERGDVAARGDVAPVRLGGDPLERFLAKPRGRQLLAEGEDEVFLVIAHAHRVNGNLGPAGLIRSAGPLAIVGGVVAIGDQDDVLVAGEPLVVSGDGAGAADAGPGDDFAAPGRISGAGTGHRDR